MTSTRLRDGRALESLSQGSTLVALVVADEAAARTVRQALRHPQIETRTTPHHGAIAAELLESPSAWSNRREPLFVLDLRSSCGEAAIRARSADYDAALQGHVLLGHPWPKTLCLIEPAQTRPEWLRAHPHVRATLLADEVETVIGSPDSAEWIGAFQAALDCCLRE